MSNRYHIDIESFIDAGEEDITLRCLNWRVDVFIFTEQLSKVLAAKWSRAAYLQQGV